MLQVAVGAGVMLCRNTDTSKGLVNGAVCTMVSIKPHHITVQFDNVPELYQVERSRAGFIVMKKIFVYRKTFPLILAFAVTIHKCQGLPLDCAMMELSDDVFSPGMAYVALYNLIFHFCYPPKAVCSTLTTNLRYTFYLKK